MSSGSILYNSPIAQAENTNSIRTTICSKGDSLPDESNITLLQKQRSFKSSAGSTNAIRIEECGEGDRETSIKSGTQYEKNMDITWIFCAPCIWLRSSTTIHKVAITTATFLVTGLLVASPILFLISTAPSQLPKDCLMHDDQCILSTHQYTECNASSCKAAAISIQSKINWNLDPCDYFKNFSCADNIKNVGTHSLRTVRTAQETVDSMMQILLQHNTTSGLFRKVGRLFSSCLRQSSNSSTIFLFLQQLGGYLPIGALGPSNTAPLLSKMFQHGPTPIIDTYYDLSYGRRPQILLIISGPTSSSPILENPVRWRGPRSPSFQTKHEMPKMLNFLLESFLPATLSSNQKFSERESIETFIKELNKIKAEHANKGFWDSSIYYNVSDIQATFPFVNWGDFVPNNWKGPIIVRNSEYLKDVQKLFSKYPSRVAHNSLLLLFVLGILPQGVPDAMTCTKATMWALPEITSALYLSQYTADDLNDVMRRTESIFKTLKAHLKRAPSLKGAALVKLSALKIRCRSWEGFQNWTMISENINTVDITSDNWFQNILRIYQKKKASISIPESPVDNHDSWAYPIVAKSFYDTLSHSIVVPLSIILVPFFDNQLPPYLQYASVGVAIAKEILQSITKNFEDKALFCVPNSINIFSNESRTDILIQSGGMQIAYHSMLSLSGPIKGMARLPGLNLTASQIFFLVAAQEFCGESNYEGVDIESTDFEHILTWLIAQGGSAAEVFKCPWGSTLSLQKTCNIF